MASRALSTALVEKLPILFVYIGWARNYDGTESIEGNFEWLRGHPTDNSERDAFWKADDGYFYCGVGAGELSQERLHVVFVARDPVDQLRKVVGVYPAAEVHDSGKWSWVRSKLAVRIPVGGRPPVPEWPGNQGMRRWAWRGGEPGTEYPALRRFFRRAAKSLVQGRGVSAVWFSGAVGRPGA